MAGGVGGVEGGETGIEGACTQASAGSFSAWDPLVSQLLPVSFPAVTAGEDFDRGLSIRREVLGDEFVDANLAGSDEFMMTFQHLVTELAWGRAWSGTALDRKSKALLTLGILAALGRYEELAIYARGALTCGATVGEIEEVLVHVTIYCGTPAGRQSFLAVHEALLSAGAFPAE